MTEEQQNQLITQITDGPIVTGEKINVAESATEKPLSEEQKAYVVCDRELKAFLKKLNTSYGARDAIQEAWGAAAIYPFAKEDPKFAFTAGRELFDHFMELNSAKFVMFLHGMEREGKIKILEPILNPVPVVKEENTGTIEEDFYGKTIPVIQTEGEQT